MADLDTRTASEHLGEAHQKLEDVRGDVGGGLIDDQFFAMDHAATHTAVAWLDQDVQRLREEVFVAAIDLHRVFILAAAKPLRHNIGAVMSLINGRVPETGEQEAIVPDLWSSLFLVVPLISTTFASVRRMLGILPPESIGWLFVDEAGQATPQSAIGALVRARRAIIVGDPLQIEPVVALPVSLTQAICDHFNVDDATFNAPVASCQSLADRASAYATRIDTADGMRTIGLPLLVHRRCSEPMFEIANEIAYGGLMVQAKVPRPSTIGDVLGPSAWFDVAGTGDDKWCPAEAAKVVEILRALKDGGAPPDLYVVTPFRIVASRLSDAVAEDAALNRWLRRGSDGPLPIGTVHTVQGREAEAIILILGAPGTAQHGARSWAGGRPNLLNVAVTRAKERLYVVGNRTLWREAGHFQVLDELIDSSTSASLNAARD